MRKSQYLLLILLNFSLLLASCLNNINNTEKPGSEPEEQPAETKLSISSIEPDKGAVGTKVVISGKGFSPNLAENAVTFNDIKAELKSATETEITAIVPDEAESGPVAITVGEETVTGPNFTVIKPAAAKYKVKGMVTVSGTQRGLEGVEISFSNGYEPVYTDDAGAWWADSLQGPVAITVKAGGWDFPVNTRLALGPADDINFVAESHYTAPNSNLIAYQYRGDCTGGTNCKKPYSIWVMNSTGVKRKQLTDNAGSDRNPTWSPDASKIAFDSDRGRDGYYIRIMKADGTGLKNTGVKGQQPSWSRDGKQIAYVHDGNIRVMNLNGNYKEIFTTKGYASSPVWSPDGSKIAFALRKEGGGESHIWVMESDGSYPTQLTHSHSPNRFPTWEWNGGRILYSSGNITWKDSRLRIMNADGSNDHREQQWADQAQSQPAWSPDGKDIVYVYRSMVPIYNRIHWMPFDNDAWMPIAPDRNETGQFWAEAPEWAPIKVDDYF